MPNRHSIRDNPRACLLVKDKIFLPIGRLSYPHLLVPVSNNFGSRLKYSTSVILERNVDFSLLKASIVQKAQQRWGNSDSIKWPILEHARTCRDPALAAQFPYLIRCNTERPPGVCDANFVICEDDREIYPGRWARIAVNLYAWEHRENGKGVSAGLHSVVLLDHDTILHGNNDREDLFEEFSKAGPVHSRAEAEFGDYFTDPDPTISVDSVFSDAPSAPVEPGQFPRAKKLTF